MIESSRQKRFIWLALIPLDRDQGVCPERILCALYSLPAAANTVAEELCVLVTLLHGDDRVGEYRVAVVSPRLPDSRPALCA
jgi:hypothetical protein